jgi:phosphatidylinositol glycan class V
MAGPMLWLLLQTSVEYLRYPTQQRFQLLETRPGDDRKKIRDLSTTPARLPQLVMPQIILAITAATNFHVQVINRLSSGYPVWYITIAEWMITQDSTTQRGKRFRCSQWICRGLIMYALVQGTLFSNFLPPA